MKPADLAKTLLERYKVWTVAIDSVPANVHGVRVTPQTAGLDAQTIALSTSPTCVIPTASPIRGLTYSNVRSPS
jgi:hypothetical protein